MGCRLELVVALRPTTGELTILDKVALSLRDRKRDREKGDYLEFGASFASFAF